MITDIIVTAFLAGIDALTSLFPTITLGQGEGNGGTLSIVEGLNGVFPVFTVGQILAAAIAVQLLLYLLDLGIWVYHQFWGSS